MEDQIYILLPQLF